ncbi:MAG TPA: STAS domain-containing protein [Gammaproteobacteria bacterium]|nr:STAS domain-containing protein [Gammaproteobacteria bacterium]
MQQARADIQQQEPRQYRMSGTVDFNTAPDLLKRSLQLLAGVDAGDGALSMDLSGVDACNSAALALLLEIFRQAQLRKLDIQFKNLPDNLLSIARAYGVEDTIRDISQ